MFLIVVSALFWRLLWLDRVPIAIVDDELDYIFDAKSIFLSGKDLSGEWSPFSLKAPPHQVPKAELPALVIAPLIGPLKFSLFSARLPFVIWGVILLITLFLIARRFFGDKVALIVAAITVINPWSLYFSRTSFDIPLALVFYLIAFYLLISRQSWWLLLAFPFLFLAFFSYIGTKLIFLPFIFAVCFYSWFFINQKKFTRQYLTLILLSLSVFGYFLVSFKFQPTKTRAIELLTPFHHTVVQRVNDERRLSVNRPLTLLFSNKPIVFAKVFLEKYLGVFSINFLFLHGEERAPYSVWSHGLFYYSDLVFLILGFCLLFVKNRRLWLFLMALVAIAPLPAALSTVGIEYALRGILLYPVLILFIGLGIYSLLSYKKSRLYRFGMGGIIVALYLIQLLNFLNIYFFRNPIYNSEGFGFNQRVLAKYLNLVKPQAQKISVVGAADSLSILKRYLFYSGIFEKNDLSLIRDIIASGDYHWENIYFFPKCPKDLMINEGKIIILLPEANCLPKENYPYWLSISQLGDGGEIAQIYGDPVCHQFDLSRYPVGIEFNDFKVEELSAARFCEKFISDLTGYSKKQN